MKHIFSLLIALCFLPIIANAQLNVGLSSSDISVTLNPENPGPNQVVGISIESFAMDLNSANIVWLVNGKKTLSGIGQKQLTVTTGKLGQKTSVNISISSQTGTIEKNFSITPTSVDLIWETDTYTPPFFKGKPLFTAESAITFIAIPHIMRNGVEINPLNLIYKWSNNGTVYGDQGGYGKNNLTIVGSILPRPMDIVVEATDPQSGNMASGEIVIAPLTPFVLFYKNNPLYGVEYQRALAGTYSLSEREIEVTAVPYYFAVNSSFDNNLTYEWKINGVPINDDQNSASKVFRQVGDVFGTSNISLFVSQSDKMFQNGKQNVLINFQKQTGPTGL